MGRFNNSSTIRRLPVPTPAPIPQTSGLKSMVAQGMVLGAGSAVGHMAVGGIANAVSGPSHRVIKEDTNLLQQFDQCMKTNDNNFIICQDIYKMYTLQNNSY